MKEAISWFKKQFDTAINSALKNTPFSLDMLTAIAIQETYEVWGSIYTKLSADEILKVCVGDTIDAPNRSAFPVNKAALLKAADGDKMFTIAREALVEMGEQIAAYGDIAKKHPDKFCHAFGIFQYDLQFFKTNPGYFLNKEWYQFDKCLALCISELQSALKIAYPKGNATLTDDEMVYVAIAYNCGKVNFTKGFKQGYKDGSGKYYGEYISEYIKLCKTVK